MKAKYLALCPACSARLPMNDDHMKVADGSIRCGKCNTVFYAPDHLLRGFYSPVTKQQKAKFPMHFDLDDSDDQQEQVEAKIKDDAKVEIGGSTQQNNIDYQSYEDSNQPKNLAEPETFISSEFNTEPNLDNERIISNHTKSSKRKRGHGRDDRGKESKKLTKRWLWIPAILIVIFVLIFQLLIINLPVWSLHPMLRGLYSQVCSVTDCQLPIDVKPVSFNIEIVGYRKLENGKFEIKTMLTNWAYYEQSLPVIKASIVDLKEAELYSEFLKPSDYLPEHQQENTSLAADNQLLFTIVIDNPRKDVKHAFPRMELVSY